MAVAAAAVAEEAELVVTAEEARCGVAAALIGSQGVEMHVSSAEEDHATGRCRQSEVLSQACCVRAACLGPSGCWACQVDETAGDRA